MTVDFKKAMTKMKQKLGFSLVEMLVVIAIIAILVSIIVPVVGRSVAKSAAATNAANLRAIEGQISVLRVENPQIFEDTASKEGMAESEFRSYLDSAGFGELDKIILLGYFYDKGNESVNEFIEYHVFHRTADENGVITIAVNPPVNVTNVPTSKEVKVDGMYLPEGVPMTVYISESSVLASYEYGGKSYTKFDFAEIAETGKYSGTASDSTSEGVQNKLNCAGGIHVFEGNSCVCIHCGDTFHAGYETNDASTHTCTRCGASESHSYLLSSCVVCGYTCDHNWSQTSTSHSCSVCGISESHNFVLGFCATCSYTCDHSWTKTASSHSCSNCGTNEGHTFVGGICYACMYTCDHSWTKTSSTHACSKCSTSEPHTFVANICISCGYKKGGGAPCVTPDTLVTLADGTTKAISETTYNDQFLVWDFYKGEYTTAPASIIMNHGYNNYTVVALDFSDGTTVKTINGHGFYHDAGNRFVILSEHNANDYIGENFVKQDGTVVVLENVTITEEYTESWSILTATYYNCMMGDMLTITPAEVEGSADFLMPYAIGDDMKYDAEAMQADIETYGLYTYTDFVDYCTFEMFDALGLENFKVSVGKGYITWDEIMYLMSIHLAG